MKALRLALLWPLSLAGTLGMAVVALAAALWLWSGSPGSLATVLELALPLLPPGHTLEVRGVQGTVRDGGRIATLHWEKDGLRLEASDLRLAWKLAPLLQGELVLTQLAMKELNVRDRRPSQPLRPPDPLLLPLRVQAAVAVDTLNWQGTPALQLKDMAGLYSFDSKEHKLDKGQIAISSGTYQVMGRLGAQAPMALSVSVSGLLRTALPATTRSVQVQAQADLKGALAGPDAVLTLQARLQPDARSEFAKQALQAELDATLKPWQAQPLAQVRARWKSLDLAALWPQAPRTLLDGLAEVTPQGADWRAEVELDNRRPGPWDTQALPIEHLQTRLVYQRSAWTVESVKAQGGAGQLEGRGQWESTAQGTPGHWRGSARLQGLNPRALHSRLPAGALEGDIQLQDSSDGLAFETRLQTRSGLATGTSGRSAASALQQIGQGLRGLQARGRWAAPVLHLAQFALDTTDSQLEGQLQLDTTTLAAQGKVILALPGAKAQAEGELRPERGGGELQLQVSDAARAQAWMARWPQLPDGLGQMSLRGQASLWARWQGGWQQEGRDLDVQARLQVPRLEAGGESGAQTPPWQLRDGSLTLEGRLTNLQLKLRGELVQADRRLTLATSVRAQQTQAGQWQVRLDPDTLELREGSAPQRWQLVPGQALQLQARLQPDSMQLLLLAGSATLNGPGPGPLSISWQPSAWSQQGSGAQARHTWHTQGQLQGLTLAWLEWLGQTQIANLGLRGDLVWGGQWEAKGGESPQLRASLQRTSGDLQLLADDPAAAMLRAGVRQATLEVQAAGDQLSARLRWDSERAGEAQAELRSRVDLSQTPWRWPQEAPLDGTLKVQLPPVGAWSLLAPPGWRLRGTLDADATLSGTRGAPRWQGQLRADELAVRSVADGIDFQRGSLRARVDEQALRIDAFSLQGAELGGSDGGQLTLSGQVLWPTPERNARPLLERLQMDLNARARALRVSARADRRLVVSGQLDAQLREGTLGLRGALSADQALFILPEDTAPQLGTDVRVRRATPATQTAPNSTNAQAPQAGTVPAAPRSASRLRTDLRVALDLGGDFQVRGRGLSTRVAGNVTLRNASPGNLTPLLQGELRAVQGSYRAYGQNLAIEEGVLRFSGPYDNPALDILALRPNLQQRVGVQITGTAISPIVRLYASPDLPDAEKLAWLVLGRAAAGGGAEAAVLQQAALGLDELSLRGASSSQDGSTAGATVTLGKRLSRDFYVAYERSLAGTLGTLYLFYDLSRRVTVRAQTGEQSAVDLIFTLRYD